MSCKKSSCGSSAVSNFFDYSLEFKLVDENDETVIGAYGTKYFSGDTRLETVDGEVLPETVISDDGRIGFGPMILEDLSQLPDRDIERNFFLFLPDTSYVGGFDVDTLRLTFRAETCNRGTAGCCAGFQYEQFDVSYNNKEPHHRDDANDDFKFYLFKK